MSFTYVLATNIGKVRLLIPDNDADAYDLSDEEIGYFLDQVGADVNHAAVACCKQLARKYAKQATFSADGLRYEATQRAQQFAERARELEAEARGGIGSVAIERDDGYHDSSTATEYETRIVYIKV